MRIYTEQGYKGGAAMTAAMTPDTLRALTHAAATLHNASNVLPV